MGTPDRGSNMTSLNVLLQCLILGSQLSSLHGSLDGAGGGSLLIFNSWRGKRAVHLLNDPQDPCHIYGDGLLREKLQVGGSGWNATGIDTRTVNQTEWLQVLNECYRKRLVVAGHKTPTSIELIFPGTKWCGAGDIAAHVWDLGTHHKTDRCCREHDFCFDVMPPRTCKYGLCNNSLFTKSHCECDDKFRRCLMNTREPASISVGLMFFDVGALGCFQEADGLNGHICRSYVSKLRDTEGTAEELAMDATTPSSEKSLASSRWCFVSSRPFKVVEYGRPREDEPQADSRSFYAADPVLRRVLSTVNRVKSIVRDVARST